MDGCEKHDVENMPVKFLAAGPDEHVGHLEAIHAISPTVQMGATAPGSLADSAGKKQLFVDQDKMKQQLRERMSKPPYDVTEFYHKTGWAQKIARHRYFEAATLSVIGANALWISIDTDLNGADTLLDANPVFIVAENLFCTYFFFEWLVRFLAFKCKTNGLRDGWFVFDSSLVFLMVMETWVFTLIGLIGSDEGQSSVLGNASILRMARLLRLTRLARMARLLRSMPELMILVRGMVAATRSVVFTLMLLLVIVYVFAIAFRQLTDGTDIGLTWFPSVLAAMHILIIHGAFMDDMGSIAKDIEENAIGLLPVFYAFVLLASLTLMNMLIGVLCEVVSAVASTEKEAMTINYVKEVLTGVLQETDLDANKDGLISKNEFLTLFERSECTDLLDDVGVDVVGLLEFSDFIFVEEDDDHQGEEKTLTYAELIEVILDLRGTNTTTVKDIVDLRRYVKQQVDGLAAKIPNRKPSKSKTGTQRGREALSQGLDNAVPQEQPQLEIQPPFSDASDNMKKDRVLNEEIGGASSFQEFEVSNSRFQHLEALLLECQSFITPLTTSLDQITKQVGVGLQAVKEYDRDFAEMRHENKKLLDELSNLNLFEGRMPGVPDNPTELLRAAACAD